MTGLHANPPDPRVVIVGGGFGGLAAARALARARVRITLIDRRNHHLFQPLLYEVATAALNPSDIAIPIRRIFRHQANLEVILAEVTALGAHDRIVRLSDGEIPYDYLVVATGATHSYFGHDGWSAAAPGLKTLEDATEIRRRVLVAYEAAERERDSDRQREWMTFVIVGAGPTGVEMAGALAEISRRVLERDFRRIQTGRARIILVEAAPRVLPAMSERSSASALRQLERHGVEVITGAAVEDLDDLSVTIGSRRIAARTIVWAAGVAASPLGRTLGVPLDRAGRVIVNDDLSVPGAPHLFVIGDLAAARSAGRAVPGLAPAALQEGRQAARNIMHLLRGEPTEPFDYRDKGVVATIGRAAAVAEFGRLKFGGLIAWILWSLVHIFYLIGFRNRLRVLAEWGWVYLRNERGARLITGEVAPLLRRGRER
jgi:NADH:quinone reductase (non-electrogenic)